MSQVSVGETIKVQFSIGVGKPKEAKVLAIKPGMPAIILVEAHDGTVMGTLKTGKQYTDHHEADMMCPMGATGYTREKALKTLGFRQLVK